MIYKLDHDYQNCYSLLIDGVELFNKMPKYKGKFRAKSRIDEWVAPDASFFASENYEGSGESIPDITTWLLGNLVLSPRAYDVFADLLGISGEFLPIHIGSETYYIFNTLYVIPEKGIDTYKAVDVIDSGVHMGQDNVLFKAEALDANLVFKTPTDKLCYTYATETFVELFKKHKFGGLTFEPIVLWL